MAKEEKNKEKKVKASKQPKQSKGKSSFVKDTKAELKKVIWPSFKQLTNNTLAVISVVIIVGVIVFALDVCFEKMNSFGIDKLKEVVQSEQSNKEENSSDESETENSDEVAEDVDTVDDAIVEESTTTESEDQGE